MNKNIEVITPDLWGVRFSLIPFMTEIDYKPDAEVPAYEEWGRICNDGVLMLNKDHPGFQILKDYFPKIMGKKDKQLKRELNNAKFIKNKTEWENLYHSMIQVEKERRLKRKELKKLWQL